jgi:cytochrome c556
LILKAVTIPFAAALIWGAALAHEGATGVIAERMAAMKNMGRELKAIGEMLVGQTPFDAAAILRHAKALHENCHRASDLFPPGSIDHHSKALSAVWEKPEEFQREMQQLHRATEAFLEESAEADRAALIASVEQIEQICNHCHEAFRQPEH